MSDPNQPYGAVPPAGPPPPGVPPPPGFPPPGFPPPGGSAGGPAGPGHPGGPARPHGKGRGLLIALGVVGALALVGVVVALVLLLVGDDDGSGADDGSDSAATGPAPDEVVKSLLDAAGDDDCDEAKSHLTEAAQAADPCSAAEFRVLSTEDVESEVGEPRIDGDTATVPVGLTSSAGSGDYLFELEQVDGKWLVASYARDHDADRSQGTDDAGTDGPTDSSTDSPSGAPSGNSTADAVPNEPKAVVEAFFESVVDGDCATAEDLVTDAYLEEEGECDPSEVPTDLGDQIAYTVGTAEVDEDAGTATVPVEVSFSGQKQSTTVRLVMESGQWRINESS